MSDSVNELLRYVRASERISPITRALRLTVDLCGDVREVAPELGPELDAVIDRATEALDHLGSAIGVLTEKAKIA